MVKYLSFFTKNRFNDLNRRFFSWDLYSFCHLGANLLGAAFNGLLSEALSKELTQSPLPTSSLLKVAITSTKREFVKLFYYLPRMIGVLILAAILYFIPVVNLLAPVVIYWFSAWMMAIEYLDYPADNHHVSFKELLKIIKKEKGLCLSFGLTISLFASIPFANFIVMPAAVLGATYLWHERFR
jgi:CysZ protein